MEAQRSTQAMQQLRAEPAMVLPSLLQCDFGNLERELARLEEAGVKALHLDVMDGHFVPNLSYGMPIVEGIRRLTRLPLDVHLMISQPGKYVQQFVDAGADCLTIHVEIPGNGGSGSDETVRGVLEQIRAAGVGVGLALNPATPLSAVEPLLPICDLLLIMSVNAGFGGQSFNTVALEKLRTLKEKSLDLLLEIDGGVNSQTIAQCHAAGATLFVVGSAIFGQKDYRLAMRQLMEAIGM
ncbi:MAG: ribulose-phosphate 3-epimerase [Pirellulaceae bacterium]